jgi:hypothetical protein
VPNLLSLLSGIFDNLSAPKGPLAGLLSNIFGSPQKGKQHTFSSLFGDSFVPGERARPAGMTPFSNPQPTQKPKKTGG